MNEGEFGSHSPCAADALLQLGRICSREDDGFWGIFRRTCRLRRRRGSSGVLSSSRKQTFFVL